MGDGLGIDHRAKRVVPCAGRRPASPNLVLELRGEGVGTASTTMIRSVDMQIWPWFMKAPNAAALTASSRSASSSTISGALPPSSSRHGLEVLGRALGDDPPTAVEPVKLIRFTSGASISAPTTSAASSAHWSRR
jgi:hypothetical protein